MRLKFLLRSALLGCLVLLLGWSPGHSQFRRDPPEGGATPAAHRIRADAGSALPARAGDGPQMRRALKRLAPADLNGGMGERSRRLDRQGAALPRVVQPAAPTGPSPLAALIAEKANADRNKKKASSRASALPSNVPAWFREYDTDGDGQVALYEWKARGHSIEDFKKADLNGDGFITIKELMRAGYFAPSKGAMARMARELRSAQVGEFLYFELTGANGGMVWGTDVYTLDSPIATAAVHAGVLRVGEKGFVKVTILPGQDRYEGTTRNDVTTQNFFSAFARSYRVEKP